MKTTKEKIEIMQAYERGKQIQFFSDVDNRWKNIDKPVWNWSKVDYRIKPEYIPFQTAQEFLTAQEKYDGIIYTITGYIYDCFVNKNGHVCIPSFDTVDSYKIFSLSELFDKFTFNDGSPCGKKIIK